MIVLHEAVAVDQVEGELLGLDGSGNALADVEEDVLSGDDAAAGDLGGQELEHVARHHDLTVFLSSVNNKKLGVDAHEWALKRWMQGCLKTWTS